MALNLQTFKTRALTAGIFVMIMLLGLLWNHWSFFILFSVIHFGCWVEYQKLVALIDTGYARISPFHKYGVMIAGWCIMLYFSNDAYHLGSLSVHAIGWWIGLIFLFVLPIAEFLFSKELNLKNIGYSVTGLIYISLDWGFMIDCRNQGMLPEGNLLTVDNGRIIPCLLVFSIWINDTMAYMVGSLIGKTPLSRISPKKTWEGTVGGALLCILLMDFLGIYLLKSSPADAFVIAAIAAIAGTAGDLLESKLKRMANVKDSGQIMPGHGGFLDRFDSLILATPIVWLYVMVFR